MDTKHTFQLGDIVMHVNRKSACYVICEVDFNTKGYFLIRRVKKQSDYPLVGNTLHRCFPTELTFLTHFIGFDGKDLKAFVEPPADTRPVITAEMYAKLPEQVRKGFENCAAKLSPENLSCDGEASRTYIRQKKAQLDRVWALLEVAAGCRVTEDVVWNCVIAEIEAKRNAVEA